MTPLPAGSTIGILGGGQLGRMLAIAAAPLGYRCHIFAPPGECVAGDVAAQVTVADYDDEAALARFAAACDVVTYEFENVPVAPLAALGDTPLYPSALSLDIAADRLAEKRFATTCGGTPARHAFAATRADLDGALASVGVPAILKSTRFGYDGKGQARVTADSDLDAAWQEAGGDGVIAEALVAFEAELSVILVRAIDGTVAYWDSPANVHVDGILSSSTLPAPAIVAAQTGQARALTAAIADALDHVGVLTCEFFATADGPVFNEMAPRVHNSGHWTIEGAATSQFANHIRAITGLPLGPTHSLWPAMRMDNLIGADGADHAALIADAAAYLHLYGKREVVAGRKMGHVTRIAAAAGGEA